jgi:pimeloyl-ACP methyl ester carboxylesterase
MVDKSSLYKSPEAYAEEMAFYDTALGKLPVPYKSLFIPTSFGETHVVEFGKSDAPVVILMHGLGANALSMRSMFTDFSKNYQVYVPDAVGYSGKSAPTRPPIEKYTEWMMELFDALNIEKAHMVGISLGGWLSLRMYLVAPQRISSLTLMSSAGFVATSLLTLLKLLSITILATMPFTGHRSARRFLQLLTSPTTLPDQELVEVFYRLLKFFKSPRELPPCLMDEELRKIFAPTLILMGQYDKIFHPTKVIKRAQELMPNLVAAELISNVGHFMNAEKPEVVNSRILKFLSDYD